MMKSSYYLTALLACAASLIPAVASAAHPTAAQGDLLMGFHVDNAPGVATSFVVNIGHASTYRDATGTITIGNIYNVLGGAGGFGSDWPTRPDLHWGVGACSSISAVVNTDPANTLYVSRAQVSEGTPQTPFPTFTSKASRNGVAADFNNLLGIGISGGFDDSTASPSNVLVGIEADSYANSWRSFLSGGTSTNGLVDFDWDSQGVQGTSDQTLSLFRYAGNSAGSTAPTYLGYFRIEGSGDITYTPNVVQPYSAWATAHVGGQAGNLDFDHNGVPNAVEYFMGTDGTSFSTNPQPVNNTITWPRAFNIIAPTSVKVQTSTDLVNWTDVMTGLQNGTGPIEYFLAPGQPKIFVRLNVTL